LIQELEERAFDLDWYCETAAILTSGYIADRYPGFSDQPVELDSLREHLTLTQRLFDTLSGRNSSSEKT